MDLDGHVDIYEIEFAPNENDIDGDSLSLASIAPFPLPTPPIDDDDDDGNTTHKNLCSSLRVDLNDVDADEIASSQRSIQRHSEFWFVDGSVVLLAQHIMFRVHKSFIARHSIIFRDMFSLPQPVDDDGSSEKVREGLGTMGTTEVEGCPVVHLHDSPEDVASLLYALYDGPKFGNNDKADFRVVSGILRLASKYLIDSLRTKALEHLSVAWPATLKGWDAREEVLSERDCAVDGQRYYPNPVEVINLAREINAPSLLPSAFYDLSRYGLTEIFESSENSSLSSYPFSLSSLSLPDTQKLVLGKESSQYAVTSLIRSMATEARSNPNLMHNRDTNTAHGHGHHPPAARGPLHRHRRADSSSASLSRLRCTTTAACWRDVCELVDLATQHYLFDRERGAMDPLYVAEELAMLKSAEVVGGGGGGSTSGGVGSLLEGGEGGSDCKACARAFEIWAKKEREKLWRLIPSWFRLDS